MSDPGYLPIYSGDGQDDVAIARGRLIQSCLLLASNVVDNMTIYVGAIEGGAEDIMRGSNELLAALRADYSK